MLASYIEEEITMLVAHYGAPRRINVMLTGAPFRPLSSDDRIGEVCMVVRRTNGKLITAIKTFYPTGAFRLLTGGIDHGEAIEAALLREVAEETGLEVAVRRFLAVIEYTLAEADKAAGANPSFATFAFLVDEIGGVFGVVDKDEQIGAFREINVAELPTLADTLDNVADGYHPEIEGSWADWGRFRAVVHRAVYAALVDAG